MLKRRSALLMFVVLGEFETWESLMAIRNEENDVIDPANGNKVITKDATNSVPDQILLQGTVPSGAAVSLHYRGGLPFPKTPNMQWWIQGSKVELHLTSSSSSLNVGRDDTKVEWFDRERGTVVEVKTDRDQWDCLGPRGILRGFMKLIVGVIGFLILSGELRDMLCWRRCGRSLIPLLPKTTYRYLSNNKLLNTTLEGSFCSF